MQSFIKKKRIRVLDNRFFFLRMLWLDHQKKLIPSSPSSLPLLPRYLVMMLPLFPLLLLITSIWSILWYQKTDNDIFGVLGATSAVIGLIWGLVIAHWSINLIGLLVLLFFRSSLFNVVTVKVNQD